MRNYSDVQTDFYAAFQDLARQCEGFMGHSQTFRSLFELLVSRFGLENLDAGFKMLIHMDLSVSKDTDLAAKFANFLDVLKRIDNLEKELQTLRAQGIKPEVLTVRA